MIVERILRIKKSVWAIGNAVLLKQKVFMDHQLTGVFTKIEEVKYILKDFENASPRLNPLFHKPSECQRDNCYCIS